MGFGGGTNQSATTPFRKTRLRLDVAQSVLLDPAWTASREGHDIHANYQPPADISHDVMELGTGVWVMQPIQVNAWTVRERDDRPGATLRLADYNSIVAMKERARWRNPTELGISFQSSVMPTGDWFQRPEVAASNSLNDSFEADVASFGRPLFGTPNAPLGRVQIGRTNLIADGVIFFSFVIQGTQLHAPDVPFIFYFGGGVTSDHGSFALLFQGDGIASLWERRSGPTAWDMLSSWRWCPPANVTNRTHQMMIYPHRKPNGALNIIFRSSEPSGFTVSMANLTAQYVQHGSATHDHVVPIPAFVTTPTGLALRQNVTGPGIVRHDNRQDQFIEHQVSQARYPPTALLVDLPIPVTFFTGQGQPFIMEWASAVPTGTTLLGHLYDSKTLAELTLVSRTATSATYTPNNGGQAIHAEFAFTTDSLGIYTPVLAGYVVHRDGLYDETITTETVTKGTHYSISGPESDPSHESANVTLKDLSKQLSILDNRSFIHSIIDTQYDANDATKRSVLFQGYSTRAEGLKKGNADRAYPNPDWREYEARFSAVWLRLKTSLTWGRFFYDVDPAAPVGPGGVPQSWKVTDLCRLLLSYPGFPPSMIDVPDSPIRFFMNPGTSEHLVIEPQSNIIDFVVAALKNYLGWFLMWDGNAGNNNPDGLTGMIRARKQTVGPYTNLATFIEPGTAFGKLPHRPESYGSTNWVGTNPTGFMKRGTFRTWVKPPEANFVAVVGGGGDIADKSGKFQIFNWAANPKSYNWGRNADGSVYESADPSHPDYIGFMIPVVIIDTLLQGQAAVDWHVRRYYDFLCHAIKMASFQGPLLLINDPADTALQKNPRPLRYYDPVLIKGAQFLVRNCNPDIVKDDHQMMQVEAEAPRF